MLNLYVPAGCLISIKAKDALFDIGGGLADKWANDESFTIPNGDGVFCFTGLCSPEAVRPRKLVLRSELA